MYQQLYFTWLSTKQWLIIVNKVLLISMFDRQIYRHSKKSITTGYNTFEHDHDPKLRPRDYSRLFGQREVNTVILCSDLPIENIKSGIPRKKEPPLKIYGPLLEIHGPPLK